MQKNSSGQVAVAKYQTIPNPIKVRDTDYIFTVRANICLSWINPEHVSTVLSITRKCCGGNRKPMFRLANESDVRRHAAGGGR